MLLIRDRRKRRTVPRDSNDFFRAEIDQMVDLSHPLAVLARRMPRNELEKTLALA